MKRTLFAAMLAGAFLLGGCSDKPKDSADVAENANEAMIDSGATGLQAEGEGEKMDDADFMVKAAVGGMFEVEAAKLAQSKGTAADVKKFADMMIADHTKANDELKAIAAAKNVQLPVALDNEHQDMMDKLSKKSGVDFDHDYMSMMEDSHKETEELLKDGIEDAQDPQLKAWATKTLPTVQQHLSMSHPVEEHQDHRKDAM